MSDCDCYGPKNFFAGPGSVTTHRRHFGFAGPADLSIASHFATWQTRLRRFMVLHWTRENHYWFAWFMCSSRSLFHQNWRFLTLATQLTGLFFVSHSVSSLSFALGEWLRMESLYSILVIVGSNMQQAFATWVCLKIGYTPNYSHVIGIMISKTIGCRGTLFSDKPICNIGNFVVWLRLQRKHATWSLLSARLFGGYCWKRDQAFPNSHQPPVFNG